MITILLVYFMNTKTYALVILLKRGRYAYSIIILLVQILIYVLFLNYMLFILCMRVRMMTHVMALIGFIHLEMGLHHPLP